MGVAFVWFRLEKLKISKTLEFSCGESCKLKKKLRKFANLNLNQSCCERLTF